MIFTSSNQKLLTEVSNETGDPLLLLYTVDAAIWGYCKQMMSERDLKGLNLPGFGKFVVKPRRLEYLREALIEKDKVMAEKAKKRKAEAADRGVCELAAKERTGRKRSKGEIKDMQNLSTVLQLSKGDGQQDILHEVRLQSEDENKEFSKQLS